MIVQNMSNKEILSELLKDKEELISRLYSHLNTNKIYRKQIKSKKFPFHHWYELRTKSNNVYLVHYLVKNRTQCRKDRFNADFLCLVDTDKGKYVYSPRRVTNPTGDTNELIVYQPHFFKRYAERFCMELCGKELIKSFFTENNVMCGRVGDFKWRNSDDTDFYCYMKRGIALGHREQDGTIHYNTVLEESQFTLRQAERYTLNESLERVEELMSNTYGQRTA